MNAMVVYTPKDGGTILWSILWSIVILFVCMKSLKTDEVEKKFRMMEKKLRLMDKYYADIAKSTDMELCKVTAELNEVNDELEKAVNDREEMKHETDKVNTLLLEALKLVYELDRKMIKFDVYQDTIGTLCQTQQEVGAFVEQLKSRIVDNEVRVREVDHKVEKIEVALTMRQEEIDVVETSVQQLKGWFHKRIDIRRLRDAKAVVTYNYKGAGDDQFPVKIRDLDHTIGERMKTLNDYEEDLCLNV